MKSVQNLFVIPGAILLLFVLVFTPARATTLIDDDSISIGSSTPYDSAGELTLQGDSHFSGHAAIGPQASINGNSVVCPDCGYTYSSILTNREIVTDMTTALFVEGLSNELLLNPVAAPTAFAWGIDTAVNVKSGNSQAFPQFGGVIYAGFAHEGSGNIATEARGIVSYMENVGAGTIGKMIGFDASMINRTGGGTITTMEGFRVNRPQNTGGGVVANNYGIFLHDQSGVGSVQSYNIYSIGPTSKNYFGGDVFIGGGDLSVGDGSATTTLTSSGGNFGVATTIPGVMLGVKGAGLFDGFITVDYLMATSTTATSSIGYGLKVDGDSLVVDANGNGVMIATSTLPTTNNVKLAIGSGTASSTAYLAGGGAAGSSIILKSSDGSGCGELIFTRGAADIGAFVSAGFKVVACPK